DWIANTSLNAHLSEKVDPDNLLAALFQGGLTVCEVSEVEALDPAAAPAEGRYRFVLRRHAAAGGIMPGGKLEQRLLEDLGRVGSLRLVDVQEVERLSQGGEAYRVTVAPTPVTRLIWLHD